MDEIIDIPSEQKPNATQAESQLAVAVKSSGLELETATKVIASFQPLFDQAEVWRQRVAGLNITDVSQTREMKLAHDTRMALRDIRVAGNNTRVKLKEDVVRRGKAIDGAFNVLKFLIEPLEAHLYEQEQFAELQEAKQLHALKLSREELLKPYGVDTSFYNLDVMPDEAFADLLAGTKAAAEAKLSAAKKTQEDAAKAEADRLAKEKTDAEERDRVRQENERLKKEADEAKAARDEADRKTAADKLAADKAIADAKAESDRLAKEAQDKADADAKAAKAESDRLVKEANDKAAAAEKARLDAEAAAQKAADEASAKAKADADAALLAAANQARALAAQAKAAEDALQAERNAKTEADRQEAERQRLAALAPDADKLTAFQKNIAATKCPEMSTPEGKEVAAVIDSQTAKFAGWIEATIKKMGAAVP